MKILLVRHGETNYNKERKVQGHSDIELNETGIMQGKNAGEKIKKYNIDIAFASPLKRAYDTARYMSDNSGNENHKNVLVIKDKNVIEKYYGIYEAASFEEYEKGLAKGELGGMETDEAAADRMEKFFKEKYKEYKDKTILVVCHGGVIRSFFTEKKIKNVGRGIVKNTSLSVLNYNGEKFEIEEFNL